MTIATEVIARRYENVSAGTPIDVDFPMFEASELVVYYGKASLVAVQNTDYTYALAGDFYTFTVTPQQSLIDKINALIAIDATEENYIVVRLELDYTTNATPAGVRYTPFTSREFERTVLRFQQLDEKLNRALVLAPGTVGNSPLLELEAVTEGFLGINASGNIFSGDPTLYGVPVSASNPLSRDLGGSGGDRIGAYIYVDEQLAGTGSPTDWDKLQAARDKARPGDTIVGHRDLNIDQGDTTFILPTSVSLEGAGMRMVRTSVNDISYMVRGEQDGEHQKVRNVYFDPNGGNTGPALFLDGVDHGEISGCEFVNFSESAFVFQSSNSAHKDGASSLVCTDNHLWKPAAGVGHPLMIKSVTGRGLIENVLFARNRLFGTDYNNRDLQDYTVGNEFWADAAVFHGVRNLVTQNNLSAYSGSAGYTISRLCEKVYQTNDFALMCMEPGFNYGSALERIAVDEIETYTVEGAISASISGVTGTIKAIVPDTAGATSGPGELWIAPSGGWFVVDDVVTQSPGANPGTAGTILAVDDITHGVEDLIVSGCKAIDVGIQHTDPNTVYAAYNAIRVNDWGFYNNFFANPSRGAETWFPSTNGATKIMSASNAKVRLEGNTPSYADHEHMYSVTGPEGEIVVSDDVKQHGLRRGEGAELTIAAGSVTPTHGVHPVDTEADAATDNLTDFGRDNLHDGDIVAFKNVTSGRVVTVLRGANFAIPESFELAHPDDRIVFMYDEDEDQLVCIGAFKNGVQEPYAYKSQLDRRSRTDADIIVNDSTDYVDITGTIDVPANATLPIRASAFFRTAATPAIKFKIVATGDVTGQVADDDKTLALALNTDMTPVGGAAVQDRLQAYKGFVSGGAGGGTVKFQFAQNTADPTDTIVRAGADIEVKVY